jgi:hypothetical protein
MQVVARPFELAEQHRHQQLQGKSEFSLIANYDQKTPAPSTSGATGGEG